MLHCEICIEGHCRPASRVPSSRHPSVSLSVVPEFENRMSTGVNDDLFARCLVLDDGAERCSLVSLDVFALNPQLERAIKDAIFQSNSINSTNILIACTGNTTSPATWQDPKFDAVGYENYLRLSA